MLSEALRLPYCIMYFSFAQMFNFNTTIVKYSIVIYCVISAALKALLVHLISLIISGKLY